MSSGVRPRRPPPTDNPLPPAPPSPTASYSDREDGQLGKKRKTPSSMQCGGRDDYSWDRKTNACAHDKDEESPFQRKNGKWVLNYYRARSRAAKASSWRKALFLRRKAALITLFLDAQTAVTNELKKGVERSSLILPEVAMFEQMLPSLENIAVGDWPMDNPGWRTGMDAKEEGGALEHWRTGYEKRRRLMQGRRVIVRGGWVPEGSFEFEERSEASNGLRASAKDQAALAKLAVVLRTITLAAKPATTTTTTRSDEPELKRSQPNRAPAPPPIVPSAKVEPAPVSKTNSSQGSDVGKKKPKKKKRSVLANQSNPHHVDNYRPSRLLGVLGDPLEPYPSHANLLFPPPMRFLSTRPRTRTPGPTGQPPPTRPAEDDYICTFCEYTLFYGSEEARKRAIRSRRRELRRKQTIKNRAKNVADGKGKGNLGREEEDWDEDEDEQGEGCHGRCSCGRPLSGRSRTKDPPDPSHHDHHHDHHHHHHDHSHDVHDESIGHSHPPLPELF